MNENVEQRFFEEERKKLIINYVDRHTKATVSELCGQFSVSSATIRNDLRALAQKGLLKRTHGGAISNKNVSFEQENVEKSVRRIDAKQAIAEAALDYIQEGDSIGLDAGTTTYELAKLLTRFNNLTIVTYDIGIANYLENNTQNRIIIAGGMIRKRFNYTVGEMALSALEKLNIDTFFLSVNGISLEKGVSTPDMETSRLKRIMMKNSGKTILLADSTKAENISFVSFANISDLDGFITDADVSGEFIAGLEQKNVNVHIAEYENKKST